MPGRYRLTPMLGALGDGNARTERAIGPPVEVTLAAGLRTTVTLR